MARKNRYTVYDLMDDKGVFEKNPANAISPNYTGPQEYPKMLYHPKGEERVTQKAEIVVTPLGPEKVGEQRELKYVIVNSLEEEEVKLSEGWHKHPALAIGAANDPKNRPVPAMGPREDPEDLEQQIKIMTARLAQLRKTNNSKVA